MAEEVRTVQTDGHRIIKEVLLVRNICAKLVLKNLSDEKNGQSCVCFSGIVVSCDK
jgi:hypothetical protein